jgi:hypothetical protein
MLLRVVVSPSFRDKKAEPVTPLGHLKKDYPLFKLLDYLVAN